MIHVVEAISDTNIGGAGVLLLNRLEYMQSDVFKTTVVLPKNSLLCEKIKNLGISVYEIEGCYDRSFDIKSLGKYIKILKSLKPDIVNSHGCMNARIAARLAGVKSSVFTRHCDFPIKKIYQKRLIRSIVKKANLLLNDGIIAVSHSAKNNLTEMGVGAEKITVIVNGSKQISSIDAARKYAVRESFHIPDDVITVSIFARLESYKDHKTLLRAAQFLPEEDFRVLIIGTGSLDSYLKKYAKFIGVDNKVIFVGFKDDITEFMNITDINVNCSIGTETSSLAISEGMSLGIPAIVSDYSGNTYMIRDLENGMIFKQGDHIALAEKIKLLSADKELYKKLSRNARKRFLEELNAENMSKKTQEYYKAIYNKTHRTAK